SDAALSLGRNAAWWATTLRLGPALDGVRFSAVAAEADRLDQLISGAVQAARPLDPAASETVAADPLLRTSGEGDAEIFHEASVRGLDQGSAVPVLSRVWLTTIAD
ncbi:MAG: hypothetical protein ACRDKH_01595, partial [Solirubrobacterales bacterium]